MQKEKSNKKSSLQEPFVSVLTPVYNGEKYLRECIESVLDQNYEHWDYVLVDNQSTDGSLDIMREYAAQDSRIRIHENEEFLPQMENLNHVFRQVSPKSKYCKVVHADDWLFPNCLSEMVALAEKYPRVGIVNSYYLDDDIVRPEGVPHSTNVIDGYELGRDYLFNSHSWFGSPSNILIKTKLILERDEPYDPDNFHSDHGLCLDILKTHDFGFVHQVLTFSRRHEQSHTNQVAYKFGTFTLGRIKNLINHGDFYLSDQEFRKIINQRIDKYHYNIASKTLFGDSEVRDFHFNELEKLGIKLNKWKMLKCILSEIFSLRRFLALKKRIFNKQKLAPGS